MIKLICEAGKISDKEIVQYEEELGFSFSDAYKDFLKNHNGSELPNNYIDIPPGQEACVSKILPVEEMESCIKIINDDVVTHNYFPFAADDCGNYFLMDRGGHCIYFYDHEHMGKEAITKIADSLDCFLQDIKPVSLNDLPMPQGRVLYMNEEILNKFRNAGGQKK